MFVTIMLFLSACIDGYKDDWTFSPGVEGVTLESPKAEDVTFTPNPTGTEVRVEWPVVYGSGGYQFSLYIVDDPEKPVVVGEENETVDGCSVERELLEDTKYKVVLKTLGNEKYNNKGAETPAEVAFSTLVDATLIPAGTNLTTYFAETSYESDAAFELQGGADYTMTGDINFGTKNIVIRGNKVNHPQVTVSGRFVSKGAGIKLKFIDFNLTGFTKELINYTDISAELPIQGTDKYAIVSPVLLDACKISGMTNRFINSSSSTKYFLSSLTIKNSIIEQAVTTSTFIQFSGSAFIKDFTISNSTLYNQKGGSAQRLLQYGNGNIAKSGCSDANLTLTNNTLYNIAYTQSMANYNMMRQATYKVTAKKNVFVDCGNKKVISGFVGGNGAAVRECVQNAYWYNGAFPTDEIGSNGDQSGTHFEVDPGLANPSAADFTIGSQELITAGIGDPRWLPTAE